MNVSPLRSTALKSLLSGGLVRFMQSKEVIWMEFDRTVRLWA